MPRETINLAIGQCVPWPSAPDRLAQVDELLRVNVRVCYCTKTGRVRRPLIRANRLARLIAEEKDPLLPLINPIRPRGAKQE